MADISQFTSESLRKIQQDHTRLKALASNVQRVAKSSWPDDGEIVRTVTGYTSTNAANPVYPSGGNVYVVRLRDYYYPETVGAQAKATSGNSTQSIIARTWDGSAVTENTPVVCDLIHCIGYGHRWWIRPTPRQDTLYIKNATGGPLSAGAVVEITSAVVTPLARYNIVLNGITRAGVDPPCAVLLEDATSNAIVEAVSVGIAIAPVDIIDADNTHARVVPGSTQLRGDFGGWARILYKPSGTGVKTCVVNLGHNEQTVRKARATTTITDGGTGSADIYISGSQRGNVTVHFNWFTGSGDIVNGSDLMVQYYHDEDKWVVVGAECPP